MQLLRLLQCCLLVQYLSSAHQVVCVPAFVECKLPYQLRACSGIRDRSYFQDLVHVLIQNWSPRDSQLAGFRMSFFINTGCM